MSEPLLPVWLTAWGLVVLAPVALLVALVASLLERSSPIRLRHWAEEAGGSLRALYDAPARFEGFRFLMSFAAGLLPVAGVVLLWSLFSALRTADGWWLAPAAVAAWLAVAEWVKRSLVERHAETALSRLTVISRIFYQILRPAVWVMQQLVVPAAPRNGEEEDEVSDEELDAFIDVGRREGILEPEEEEMVRSIVDFGDTQVRSVMTPRVEMISAPVEATLEELAAIFFEAKHARLPIFSGSVDKIVGILHIRDLFEALHAERETTTEELSNPPFYVPETKPSRELLEELQALHQQMAIVVDEYGGVAGVVTVEDLVEEIVGEIQDEHEATTTLRVRIDDERWRIKGRTDLEELGELYGVDFDDLPYETVSGMICGELGYVPKPGETFDAHDLSFAVEEADERRITSVVVRRTAAEEAPPP